MAKLMSHQTICTFMNWLVWLGEAKCRSALSSLVGDCHIQVEICDVKNAIAYCLIREAVGCHGSFRWKWTISSVAHAPFQTIRQISANQWNWFNMVCARRVAVLSANDAENVLQNAFMCRRVCACEHTALASPCNASPRCEMKKFWVERQLNSDETRWNVILSMLRLCNASPHGYSRLTVHVGHIARAHVYLWIGVTKRQSIQFDETEPKPTKINTTVLASLQRVSTLVYIIHMFFFCILRHLRRSFLQLSAMQSVQMVQRMNDRLGSVFIKHSLH